MRLSKIAVALTLGLVVACSGNDTAEPPTSSTASASTSSSLTTSSSTTSSTSVPAGQIVVQVFFLDQDAFNVGRPPFVRPVDRLVAAGAPEAGALDALFAGPTADEGAGGLRFVPSGASGYTGFRLVEGTAFVQLVGGCSSGGSTFTIADEITATLRQFTGVQDVKILDPDGGTEVPNEPGDSIPFCLEP